MSPHNPARDTELDNEVADFARVSLEDFCDLLDDPAHERDGIQKQVTGVHVDGNEMVVFLADNSIHHYRVHVERVK